MRFVDIHLHLLPGVDDGPGTLEESLEHADRLAAHGVREAVVTPHVGHPQFPLPVDEIPHRTAELQRALWLAGIELLVRPGGEIHPTAADRLSGSELQLIAHGPPGRRWVLLEAPFSGVDGSFALVCAHLRALGFAAVIAHPERSAGFLPDGLEWLRGELALGARLQVNVCSLLGRNGEEARAAAHALVRSGLASVLASDGHGGRRAQTLRLGQWLALRAGVSPARARELTCSGPAALLADGVIAPHVAERELLAA